MQNRSVLHKRAVLKGFERDIGSVKRVFHQAKRIGGRRENAKMRVCLIRNARQQRFHRSTRDKTLGTRTLGLHRFQSTSH